MWHLHGSLGLALAAPDHDDDDDVDDRNGEDDGGGNTSCLLATSPNSNGFGSSGAKNGCATIFDHLQSAW